MDTSNVIAPIQGRDHTKLRLLQKKLRSRNLRMAPVPSQLGRITLIAAWLVDSKASSHMAWDKELLTDYQEFKDPREDWSG